VVDDARTGGPRTIDWEAIERMEDFQTLAKGRRRFAWTWGSIGTGIGALYVVLAGVSPDLMGTKLFGDMSLGFAGGVGLILVTWAITFAYMRRSDRVWGPLEERIRAQFAEAQPEAERFAREGTQGPAPEVAR
jgi:uncharacterized membrane protein (DUF485 family)